MSDRDAGGAARKVPYGLAALGVLTAVVTAVEVVVRLVGAPAFTLSFAVGVLVSFPFSVLLVVGPFRLLDESVPPERYRRVGAWALVGGTLFTGLFAIIALAGIDLFWDQVGTVRWAVVVGTGGGMVVGVFNVQAIERAVATERANVRAQELERRKELLRYLNGLLRHEVLNAAQVIEGYADLVEDPDRGTGTTGEYLDVIRKETGQLRSVTQDVKVLLQAAEEPDELIRVDVGAAVRSELEALRRQHPEVETDVDVQGDPYVPGDELLSRVFSELFDNAVEHNDSETPHLSVAVDATDEAVRVRIEDDGPGLPERKREDVFEHTTNEGPEHDLGLAIVSTLVERYAGEVELTRTGPEGSTFTVTLPRFRASDADGSDRPLSSVSQ